MSHATAESPLMSRSPVGTFSALIQTGLERGPKRVVGAATARRLIAYYSVIVALVVLLDLIAPLGPSGKVRLLAPWLERMAFGVVTGQYIAPAWVETILAMIAAFILTVPTVIVYVRTRTEEAYDEALVNTVLVLPSVVTAILIVVQSSLALAFSLTGIVAAVRFRTNVKDSRDALYIFAGVAIGFATGVHEPEVAAAASLLFVLLELFAWRSGLGGDRAHARAVLWGERPAAAQPPPARLTSVARSDGPGKPHRNGMLGVTTTDIDEGRRAVEDVLRVTAKKWRLRSTAPNGGETVVLVYECRLRRAYTPEAVRGQLIEQGAPFVQAVEWYSSNRRPARSP
jgi:hypothetical protein